VNSRIHDLVFARRGGIKFLYDTPLPRDQYPITNTQHFRQVGGNHQHRFAFLREHPELDSLEPQILELAAQMSLESRNLAETFSVAKVERARSFLKQRQKEIVGFEQSLERARASCFELTALAEKIEDDDIRLGQKRREVEEKLRTTLVELGFELRYRPINAADTPDIPKPTKVVDTNEGRSRVIAMHAGFGPGPAE